MDKVTTMIDQFDALYKHIRYQYRQQDSLEILTTANGDSSYLSKKIFTYDQWNRVIRIEDYESKTSIQHVRIKKYKAPTLRNPISDTSQKMNPPTTPWILYYTLDSNGNMIETKNREHQVINRIVYTYDENNNWIEKKMINPKGRIYSLYRRKIEYY